MNEKTDYKRGEEIIFKDLTKHQVLLVHNDGYMVTELSPKFITPVRFFSKEFVENARKMGTILPEREDQK